VRKILLFPPPCSFVFRKHHWPYFLNFFLAQDASLTRR
jgi:hypothetical protein